MSKYIKDGKFFGHMTIDLEMGDRATNCIFDWGVIVRAHDYSVLDTCDFKEGSKLEWDSNAAVLACHFAHGGVEVDLPHVAPSLWVTNFIEQSRGEG